MHWYDIWQCIDKSKLHVLVISVTGSAYLSFISINKSKLHVLVISVTGSAYLSCISAYHAPCACHKCHWFGLLIIYKCLSCLVAWDSTYYKCHWFGLLFMYKCLSCLLYGMRLTIPSYFISVIGSAYLSFISAYHVCHMAWDSPFYRITGSAYLSCISAYHVCYMAWDSLFYLNYLSCISAYHVCHVAWDSPFHLIYISYILIIYKCLSCLLYGIRLTIPSYLYLINLSCISAYICYMAWVSPFHLIYISYKYIGNKHEYNLFG